MNRDDIKRLIEGLVEGRIDQQQALEQLSGYEELGFARLDVQREQRTGVAEVIFAPGKTFDQLRKLISSSLEAHGKVLVSRLDQDWGDQLCGEFNVTRYDPLSRTLRTLYPGAAKLPLRVRMVTRIGEHA